MEPKFQSSFIPKTAGQETAVPKEVEKARGPQDGGGFWSIIANSIFTLAIVAVILVFGAQWYLNRSIDQMGQSLSAAKEELAPERIQEINRAYDRINAVKSLLADHVMLSNLFEKLQNLTVKNVRITDLTFNMLSGKGVILSFKGQALGYVSVASQADVFNQQSFMKSPNFSDLDLDEQGAVLFTFKTNIDPIILKPATTDSTQTPTQ